MLVCVGWGHFSHLLFNRSLLDLLLNQSTEVFVAGVTVLCPDCLLTLDCVGPEDSNTWQAQSCGGCWRDVGGGLVGGGRIIAHTLPGKPCSSFLGLGTRDCLFFLSVKDVRKN